MSVSEPTGTSYGDLSASGLAGFFSISAGGAVSENFVVSAVLYDGVIQNPTVSLSSYGSASTSGTSVALIGFGPQLTWYFMPANLYLSAAVALTKVTLQYTGYNGSTNVGIGGRLSLGKEWWVSDHWGLGMAGQLLTSFNTDTGTTSPTVTTLGFGALFSATYN
jgi:hypothetical protein